LTLFVVLVIYTYRNKTQRDYKMNANRMIDTLEELIATAGMMSKEQGFSGLGFSKRSRPDNPRA